MYLVLNRHFPSMQYNHRVSYISTLYVGNNMNKQLQEHLMTSD